MKYIQLENFNGNLSIVCKDDGSGEPFIFDTLKEAEDTLKENCQDGQIVPLGVDLINIISSLYNWQLDIKSEEGVENFEKDEDFDNLVEDILGIKNEEL